MCFSVLCTASLQSWALLLILSCLSYWISQGNVELYIQKCLSTILPGSPINEWIKPKNYRLSQNLRVPTHRTKSLESEQHCWIFGNPGLVQGWLHLILFSLGYLFSRPDLKWCGLFRQLSADRDQIQWPGLTLWSHPGETAQNADNPLHTRY